MKELLKRFIVEDSGLETVEYAIITGIISAATLTAITTLSAWVSARIITFSQTDRPTTA